MQSVDKVAISTLFNCIVTPRRGYALLFGPRPLDYSLPATLWFEYECYALFVHDVSRSINRPTAPSLSLAYSRDNEGAFRSLSLYSLYLAYSRDNEVCSCSFVSDLVKPPRGLHACEIMSVGSALLCYTSGGNFPKISMWCISNGICHAKD